MPPDAAGAWAIHAVPFQVKSCPGRDPAKGVIGSEPFPINTRPLVKMLFPVPPLRTGSVPDTSADPRPTVLAEVNALVPPVDFTKPDVNVVAPVPPFATPKVSVHCGAVPEDVKKRLAAPIGSFVKDVPEA